MFYTSDTQVVARDSVACYIYNPSLGRDFCYDVTPEGKLTPTSSNPHFNTLRDYVFAMVQTAEFMQRRSK